MAGCTDETTCPKCGYKKAILSSNTRMPAKVSLLCLKCGYYIEPKEGKLTKKELEAERQDFDWYNWK